MPGGNCGNRCADTNDFREFSRAAASEVRDEGDFVRLALRNDRFPDVRRLTQYLQENAELAGYPERARKLWERT